MATATLNKQFLERLQWDGVTEISDLTHNLGWVENYDDIVQLKKDLYFISFLPNDEWYEAKEQLGKAPRTKNNYVKWIKYLKCDFDIRSYIYEHENRVISDEELLKYKDEILREFNLDCYLHTYNAVVLSGNWIHVYWIGKTVEIDPKRYAAISTKLYDMIKRIFYPDPHLRPDYACNNIWRLLRLPGSINYKSKYGLPPKEVELIEYREEDSPLLEELAEIIDDLILQDETVIRISQAEIERICRLKTWLQRNGNDTFDKINSLSIADLVCNHTWWKLAPDGRNFISNRDGKNTGAYIIPEENILVHTGTPHISDHFKVYSPFSFIMVHYADGDAKKTFEVAKEMFPQLKDEEDLSYWLVKNGK